MQAQSLVALIGRVLIAIIFIKSGLGKLGDLSGTTQHMAGASMPVVPLFLAGAIAVELLGGLSVLLGVRARIAAAVLFLFLIPTTLIFHAYWHYDGMSRQMQMGNFLKNLAIMGGLAMLVAHGAGTLSLDRLWARRRRKPAAPAMLQNQPALTHAAGPDEGPTA